MQKTKTSHIQGFAHIGIILAVVGVVVVAGLVAWRYMGANKTTDSASEALTQKLASAKCEYDDKDLCKFFTSWKEHKQYKMVSTSTQKADNVKTTATIEVDGENTHMTTTGEFAYETISIGSKTIYTKSSNGTWWKQTIPEGDPSAQPTESETPSVEFEEPTEQESANKTTYKSLGKEACGSQTCFKYQVIDSEMPGVTQYIWFDDKAYQLQRTTTEDSESSSDMTFTYTGVTVKAPSSYKELGPNQYLIPGQAEPQTVPDGGDYLME